jgi:hypothetical protein
MSSRLDAENLEQWLKNSAPFFLLASIVLEQLEMSKGTLPDW